MINGCLIQLFKRSFLISIRFSIKDFVANVVDSSDCGGFLWMIMDGSGDGGRMLQSLKI